MRSMLFSVLLVAVCAVQTAGQSIVVGDFDLNPNQAGQTVQVFVSGGELIEGANLNVQIGDGVSNVGPTIESVDLVTNTIFADPNNEGQFDVVTDPQFINATVNTPFDFDLLLPTLVPANGLLATLTVSTEGVTSGTFALKLADTLNGDSDLGIDENFDTILPAITNGTITVIPEPTTALLTGLGGLMMLRRRQMKRGA